MPELPEVQTVLEGLAGVLKNRKITGLSSFYPGTVVLDPALDEEPFPSPVLKSERRGKYMILTLERNAKLIIHLRMTGKLVYEENPGELVRHERARFDLDDGSAVSFIDMRTFGKIYLIHSQNLPHYLPNLGPEPLSRAFNADYLHNALKRRKAPVKNLLLDQSIVAGLGNIYVCELLYRSGIDPQRPGSSISQAQAKSMVKHTREVLQEAIKVGGTSVSDYRRIDDKTGEFQHFLKVYHKASCPLGHPVQKIRQAGRSSYFCPVCQK